MDDRKERDPALLLALAMTGLTALALEVLWSRAMIPWVGGTALSQITTVAIYMGGLFAGSALAVPLLPRIADPRATFLKLELLAALLSLGAVLGLPLADPLFALFSKGELLGSGLGSVLRGLAGGCLMLPATLLMGISFPLAIAACDRGRNARGSAALAYGVNTLGATLGTLIGGFLLVPRLGVTWGAVAIVAADVALLAWAWRKGPPAPAREPARAVVRPGATPAGSAASAASASSWREELPMLASILLGGMVSLGLEAILFRVLGLLLGPTARAFTVVLAVYVLGLGVGSLLVRRVVEKSRAAAELVYVACWLVVGGCGLIVYSLVGGLSSFVASGAHAHEFDFAGQLLKRAVIATIVLLPLTIAFGASYSAAVAAARQTDARRAGRLYAALTLGNILGLGVAAWGVLPRFRLDRGLLLVLAAAFLVPLAALAVTTLSRRLRLGAAATLLAGGALAAFALPLWPMKLLHTAAYKRDYELGEKQAAGQQAVVRFHRPAFETSVTVVQIGENLYLQLDGKTTGSTELTDQATQGLLGTLPAMLHPDPKRGFVIGLGSGHTPAELLRHPLEQVDCAEISPEVVQTMPYFAAINRRCDQDPRFRMLEADGRTVLRYGGTKYDVVISEPSNVWIPGVAHLFTRESFADVRGRLEEGGFCVQWLQGYGMQIDVIRAIVRTFQSVFPHTSLWFSGLTEPDILLVGSFKQPAIDVAELGRRLAKSGAVNVAVRDQPLTPVSFLRLFIAGDDKLRAFAGEGPLTSDARPMLEYAAEEALIGGGTNPAYVMIAEMCEPPLALLKGGGAADPAFAQLLERRAEANRAIAQLLAEINALGMNATGDQTGRFFQLASAYPDDPELQSTIVISLAFPLEELLIRGDRSPQLFDLIRRLIAVDPDHPESLKLASVLAAASGDAAGAIARIDRYAAAVQSWKVEPVLDRGRMLWRLGRRQEALAEFARAVERSPYYLQAWSEYSQALDQLRDPRAPAAKSRLDSLLADPQ